MTAPRRSGAEQANIRGLAVLAVAVVIGLVFLIRLNGGLVGPAAAGKSTTTGTTTTLVTTSTPPSTVVTPNTGGADTSAGTPHTPSQVKVLVVNASLETGVGAKNKTTLATAGFNVTAVKNGPATATTTIYYLPGYQADAAAVKTAINVSTAQVVALPSTPIIPEASTNDVTVALGKDYKA